MFRIACILLLALPQLAVAQVLVITKNGYYLLEMQPDGTPKLTPHAGFQQVIILGQPTPGPGPAPVPTPPLTTRAIAIKTAASSAIGDKQRERTAAMLSVLYSEIAKKARSGEVKGADNLAVLASSGATMVLAKSASESAQTQAAIEAAWAPVRTALGEQWAKALQEGATDAALAALFEEAAAGLMASVSQKSAEAIDLAKLIQIILAILEIIKQLFPQGLPMGGGSLLPR